MRNGFEFNGKNTTDFKRVTVRTKDRPVFPQVKGVYRKCRRNRR